MPLPINRNQPLIMHVDLNSCFATIEQQANPLFRGKPLVVAAYNTPGGCVVAPSIEAKRFGIKTGMTVRDAKLLYPGVIVRPPDPPKYRAVHLQFRKIFTDYSPAVSPKSIDEAVIDFTDTYALYKRSLIDIGKEIKRRFREEIGEWMRCSIGIGTNRFLAKLAASLKKPDGLTVIDHTNVLSVYNQVGLLDLNGINTKYQARLNAAGIFTPMELSGRPWTP
jgi:DNA polymerase-4